MAVRYELQLSAGSKLTTWGLGDATLAEARREFGRLLRSERLGAAGGVLELVERVGRGLTVDRVLHAEAVHPSVEFALAGYALAPRP